jgi:hypothetical protein
MRRREFTAALVLAMASQDAWSQQRAVPRIALFHPAIPTSLLTETGGGTAWRAFFGELRRLGYVEGHSIVIDRYSAEGHHERYADIAREIVARKPDLIVTGTNPVVLTFKAATSSTPIVAFMIDPLKAGLVESLARPQTNVTGITLDAGIEIWGKRLELLKEAVPMMRRVAFLGMREGWERFVRASHAGCRGSFGNLADFDVAQHWHAAGDRARFCRNCRAAAGCSVNHRRRRSVRQPPIDRRACPEIQHADDVSVSRLCRCCGADGLYGGLGRAAAAHGSSSPANPRGD